MLTVRQREQAKLRRQRARELIVVEVEGAVARLEGDLFHYSYRDLADQVERIHRHSSEAAESLHAEGRRARWWDLALRPLARSLRSYVLKRGFLDGAVGLLVAGAIGYGVFLKYAKLWDLARRERDESRPV